MPPDAQEAASGTGRTGGTAELNREAGATTNANIDSIISQQLGIQQNLQTQKQIAGAEGLAKVGGLRKLVLDNLLGLGSSANTDVLQNATESRAAVDQGDTADGARVSARRPEHF